MILLRKIGQFIAFICQFVNIKMQILNICISNSRNDFPNPKSCSKEQYSASS